MKGLEKFYPKMIFSKTLTENLLSKKPKKPETILSNMVCQGEVIITDDIKFIVENVSKSSIQL